MNLYKYESIFGTYYLIKISPKVTGVISLKQRKIWIKDESISSWGVSLVKLDFDIKYKDMLLSTDFVVIEMALKLIENDINQDL